MLLENSMVEPEVLEEQKEDSLQHLDTKKEKCNEEALTSLDHLPSIENEGALPSFEPVVYSLQEGSTLEEVSPSECRILGEIIYAPTPIFQSLKRAATMPKSIPCVLRVKRSWKRTLFGTTWKAFVQAWTLYRLVLCKSKRNQMRTFNFWKVKMMTCMRWLSKVNKNKHQN